MKPRPFPVDRARLRRTGRFRARIVSALLDPFDGSRQSRRREVCRSGASSASGRDRKSRGREDCRPDRPDELRFHGFLRAAGLPLNPTLSPLVALLASWQLWQFAIRTGRMRASKNSACGQPGEREHEGQQNKTPHGCWQYCTLIWLPPLQEGRHHVAPIQLSAWCAGVKRLDGAGRNLMP